MNVLAVIPVRGGSKGIPRKNVRLMSGKPLLMYSVENAYKCKRITELVITTDDEEIISIAQMNGIEYVERDKALAADHVTLDPVVYDAVVQMENRHGKRYDIVITLQATSPLMTGETLDNALKKFVDEKSDTCISVVNRPHLSWKKDGNCIVPAYEQRLNRQQLPANYFETGAFFITRRENVTPYSRIGKNVSVYEVPVDEATDIDTKDDWQMCESILKRKRIIFRCDGEKKIGMGHIYRCMTLAYNLTGHEVMFVLNEDKKEGIEKIKKSFLPYHLVKNNEEFFEYIQFWNADIVVNDCLDSTYNYMEQLCSKVQRVITFEDLGKGAELADVVINALYDVKNDKVHHYFCGEKYICLRDEFQLSTLGKYNQEVKNILVMFGGTDPSNLTKKIYDIAKSNKEKYPELRYNFILGSGYVNDSIDGIDDYIEVYTDVKRVSDFMRIADLAFTSQGRTVYELASMGIPAIVLAQNEREQLHSFAQMQNGFINLGLGKNVDSPTIESTLEWIIRTPQIRNEMRNLMLSHDLRSGLRRVINLIVDEEF